MPYEFSVGDRVQTHPATDNWMRGLRYGKVERVAFHVGVRFDNGSYKLIRKSDLIPVEIVEA